MDKRAYTVVIETTSEVPGIEAIAIKVDANDRHEAENIALKWSDENEIGITDIMVFRSRPGWLDF